MEYYIINENEEKLYLKTIKDGFIYFKNSDISIDLAKIHTVYKVNDEKEDKISITQYLIMTNQLGYGNEWEINKWMIYVFFSVLSILINCMFSFVGILITYYTLPLLFITFFCCYQLRKINKKKLSTVLIILSFLFIFVYLFGVYIFPLFFRI